MGCEVNDVSQEEMSLSEDLLQPLLRASNFSNPREALESLIAASKINDGRADLASKGILPTVVKLIQCTPYPSGHEYLILCLKLLRNLCAGEINNQNLFLELDAARAISVVLRSARLVFEPDCGILRVGLQVLANVCLAGEEHKQVIWRCLFPFEFVAVAKVRSRDISDPLCMIIYTCCDGNPGIFLELCGDQGLSIVTEIARTASVVGFGEDWLKLLLSRICLEEIYFPKLFSRLYCVGYSENSENVVFSAEQAYLLSTVSDILNERLSEITVSNDLSLFAFRIFKRSLDIFECGSGGKSGLPTGSAAVDVLGYSLTILRDICAQHSKTATLEDLADVVDTLALHGLIELLLSVLSKLEPPAIIKRATRQNDNQELSSSESSKPCPYRGFRRDIVAVIGNCTFLRKNIQDEIRQRNGILLLLQNCVTDDENPFLREWGIWCDRNLLEGNVENQNAVAELELQKSVEVPELSRIGLRVDVDPKTRRPRLVNMS
ncbi:ARM repeat superfamily protein [Euphorbia peplus]|nr:ARM repeat superfamily protein [Euphorbia peplus]